MYRSTILLFVLVLSGASFAQVADFINADPAELAVLAKRTLVVELPEVNPKVIDGFPKKTAAADEAAYRTSIASYNEAIEAAVNAHWKFNEKIEFKTTSEIAKLFAAKNTKYVALMKVVLPNELKEPKAYTALMGVPALVLTRTDGETKVSKEGEIRFSKPDFQSYLISDLGEDGVERYSEASLKLTLSLAQKFLKWNIGNKKSQTFMRYLEDQAKANCSKLTAKQLVVDKDLLYHTTNEAEIEEGYGRDINFVDHAEIERTYLSGSAKDAVVFHIPVGILNVPIVVVMVSAYVYVKVAIDPSTGDVLNAVGGSIGPTVARGLHPRDIKRMATCGK